MPRLTVIVDAPPDYRPPEGFTKLDEQVPAAAIPSRPQLFPQAMGYGAPAGQPLPYLARLSAITAIVEVLQQLANSPQMQPMSMDVTRHGMGKATVVLEIPQPPVEREPIAL